VTPWEEEYAEALRPVLKSSKPSRFRLLRVVCDRDHRLLDIYQTALGAIYVGEDVPYLWFTTWDREAHSKRAESLVIGLVQVGELRSVEPTVDVSCNRGHVREQIPMAWLDAQLRAGTRRAIWRDPVPKPEKTRRAVLEARQRIKTRRAGERKPGRSA
jgi:hypothetical protein